MNADLDASVSGPAGASAVNNTTGTLTASQGGTFGPYSLSAVLDSTTVITTALGKRFEVTDNFNGTVTYTPDINWTPGGGAVVTGSLDVDGSWSVGVNGKVANTTLSTPSKLIFDPECRPTRITGGVVVAAFEYEGQMASITVEWTGCDASNVTYDYDAGGT